MNSGEEKGSSRLLTKLHDAVQAKKFYEAHQLMKTISFRYTSSKKFVELESLLIQTAVTLLENEQFESGSDISIMLTKIYIDHNFSVNPDRISELTLLLKKMRNSPERLTFITNVIEWCGSSEFHLSGPFNSMATQLYMKEKAYSEAWKHLIRMSEPLEMCDYTFGIIEAQHIRTDEQDLAIGNLILNLILLKRVNLAEDVYEHVMKKHSGQPSPLLNGVRFFIEAAKRNDADAYKSIKQIYYPSLTRDSNIQRLVDSIGKSVFKLQDKKERNGFMTNIINALMSPDTSGVGSSATSPQQLMEGSSDQMALD